MKISAKCLHSIESKLNQVKFNDFELGSVLSFYFDRLYRADFETSLLKNLTFLGYYFLKSLRSKATLNDCQKEFYYFKTAIHRHYEAMEGAITKDPNLAQKTLVIGPKGKSGLDKGKVLFSSNFFDLIKIVGFIILNFVTISNSFKDLDIDKKTKLNFYIFLILQLLKANSLKKFFLNQQSIKLIGADYDRGADSSLFFVIARALKIKNFTLQHGVINPPVGYAPINADEIWVWGAMSRLQLMELGVNKKLIKKVGTPIIEEFKMDHTLRATILNQYGIDAGETIVLALSSPNKANDVKMIEFLCQIREIYKVSAKNFFVKVHPARDISAYSWIKNKYNMQILPQDMSFKDFMNITDVLLTHSSGVATEALYYGKKVGIVDILDESAGNGLELNKYFGTPLLKSPNEYEQVFLSDNLKSNPHQVYFKTGELAKEEITKRIKKIM